MERWALVSGLGGDLNLYEQIQKDLKQQRGIANLFILGDLVGPNQNCNALLDRLKSPKQGDLRPECIYGWWEDQLLAETGYRGDRKADDLRGQQGDQAVQQLLAAVDASHLNWLASLQFGFIELDCALIHGSSADVNDQLTPDTSPLILLDRLTRLDVNRLFTARSKQQFRIELTGGEILSKVKNHNSEHDNQQAVPKRSVIGIGGGKDYTLYDPATDRLDFLSAGSHNAVRGKGFG